MFLLCDELRQDLSERFSWHMRHQLNETVRDGSQYFNTSEGVTTVVRVIDPNNPEASFELVFQTGISGEFSKAQARKLIEMMARFNCTSTRVIVDRFSDQLLDDDVKQAGGVSVPSNQTGFDFRGGTIMANTGQAHYLTETALRFVELEIVGLMRQPAMAAG